MLHFLNNHFFIFFFFWKKYFIKFAYQSLFAVLPPTTSTSKATKLEDICRKPAVIDEAESMSSMSSMVSSTNSMQPSRRLITVDFSLFQVRYLLTFSLRRQPKIYDSFICIGTEDRKNNILIIQLMLPKFTRKVPSASDIFINLQLLCLLNKKKKMFAQIYVFYCC